MDLHGTVRHVIRSHVFIFRALIRLFHFAQQGIRLRRREGKIPCGFGPRMNLRSANDINEGDE